MGIWSMQASAGINYSMYPFPQMKGDATASRWAANIQVQQQWKLPGGFKLELAAFFYSRELWGIYLKDELFFADAGIRKSFFKEKLTLQLNFTDFLRTYRLQGFIPIRCYQLPILRPARCPPCRIFHSLPYWRQIGAAEG